MGTTLFCILTGMGTALLVAFILALRQQIRNRRHTGSLL